MVQSGQDATAAALVDAYCPRSLRELVNYEFRQDYLDVIDSKDLESLSRYL